MPAVGIYPRNTMLVILAGLGGLWLVALVSLLVLLCCVGSAHGNRVVAVVVAMLILTEHGVTTTGLALISGFGYMPAFASFLIAAAVWPAVVAVCMSLFSPAWRTVLLIARQCRARDAGEEATKSPGSCVAAKSFARAAYQAAMKRPIAFVLASTAALAFTLAVNIALSQVCSCSNPDTISTWASRRSDARYCSPGTFCHLYPLVGQRASRMRVVGHFVATSTGYFPFSATSTVCAVSSANLTLCAGPSWQAGTRLLALTFPEDLRYVSHTLLTNLTGESLYRVTVTFLDSGNHSMALKALTFRTPPDELSTTPVRFLAGGDIYQGAPFTQLLLAAMLNQPDPHFLLIGGDLAYANSMRTCYLRWDQLLHDLSAIRTSEGTSLPLLTIVGNHEAAGYLTQSSRLDYNFYTQFLPQYDDDNPTDPTITYHSHYFGRLLGIIALDSGIMVPVADQVPFLTQTLASMRDAIAPANNKFVIVLQHNPMYPSSRELSADTTPDIRRLWLPLFDMYKVPLVLEFHDHAYKRTFPMFQEGIRVSDGTVFVGDGALGCYSPDRTPDTSRFYLQTTAAENYIMMMTAFPNGTVSSTTFSSSGARLDTFALSRR